MRAWLQIVSRELSRQEKGRLSAILKVIVVEKLLKGSVLWLLSISVFPIFSEETVEFLHFVARHSHMLTNARIFTRLFLGIEAASDRRLLAFSLFFLIWGFIELAEGIGLAGKRRWAEYLTVVGTGLFIPVELSTVFARFTYEKFGLLLFNIFLVVYLIHTRKLFTIEK